MNGTPLDVIRAEAAETSQKAQVAGLTFPPVIDSTIRSDFVSCPRKFFEAHILNLRLMESNVHLHFGGVYARGLEVFRKSYWSPNSGCTGDVGQSLARATRAIIETWGRYEPSIPTNKTLEGCLDALLSYIETYPPGLDTVQPLMVDGEPAVEFTFALPIPGTRHPETDQPILYAGRFDMLATMRGGGSSIFIDDEKTTTQLGDSWANQWKLRGQLTGYKWGAESYGYPIGGIIIRGSSILKAKIGQAQVIEQRYNFQVSRWLNQLARDVDRMVAAWNTGFWDQAFDSACSAYGGCAYQNVCLAEDPEPWRSNYNVAPWNPLARGG